MTEKFDPWMRASSLATLLRSHRCVDIDRRLRQGAALGDIQAKARIAKLRRRMGAEWESEWTKDIEERDWEVPAFIWTGFKGARLNLPTDEYYSGLLDKDTGLTQAALIGLSFDRQQALDFFGIEPAIVDAVVIAAVPKIEGESASPSEDDQPPRSAKAEWDVEGQRVADQLDAEKISKRDVRQHHINERWGEGKGSPYSVAAIIGLMAGKPRSGRPKVSG